MRQNYDISSGLQYFIEIWEKLCLSVLMAFIWLCCIINEKICEMLLKPVALNKNSKGKHVLKNFYLKKVFILKWSFVNASSDPDSEVQLIVNPLKVQENYRDFNVFTLVNRSFLTVSVLLNHSLLTLNNFLH